MDFEKEIDDYVLIQYIILFVLANVEGSISYDVLINIITDHINVNYIEFQLALDNLICSEFVKNETNEDERAIYTITEKGITSAKLFEKDIPVYIREPIRSSVKPAVEAEKMKRLVRTKVRSLEDDMHYADCAVYDDFDTLLMKLSILAPTREEAVEITKKFSENPDEIYAKILGVVAN